MSADTHSPADPPAPHDERLSFGPTQLGAVIAAAAAVAIAARYSRRRGPGRRRRAHRRARAHEGLRVERSRTPRGDRGPARALRRAHVARRGRRGRRGRRPRRPATSSRGSSAFPLVGALVVLFMPRQGHAALKGATLALMAGDAAARPPSAPRADGPRLPLQRGRRLDAALRHPLPRRARRDHALAGPAHGLHHAHRDVRVVRVDPRRASRTGASRCCCSRAAMIGAFLSLDLFLFYVFWELMLVPMYVMIGVWGGSDRIYSAVKFFLYTMFGSVLMLGAILYVAYAYARVNGGAAELRLLRAAAAAPAASRPDLALGRLHAGLRHQGADVPGAHVAAGRAHRGADGGLDHPGGRDAQDGDLRLPALLDGPLPRGVRGVRAPTSPASPCSAASSTARSAPGSRTDVKRLIAYSSVAHLGYVMLGLFALTQASLEGSVLQMVNHGISTGDALPPRSASSTTGATRASIDEFGGLAKPMPVYATLFVDRHARERRAARHQRVRRRVHGHHRHLRVPSSSGTSTASRPSAPRSASSSGPSTC